MKKARVLFVDDEPNIRLTLPAILNMHEFEAVSAATVAEALQLIQGKKFDVLIADLNIGQPGDGFTVVSAMRRTQPDAVTIIITGFPAFETALQAIREQVDDYVVKPADVAQLVQLIENKLEHREPHRPLPLKRASTILRENAKSVIERFLIRVQGLPELASVSLSDEERTDHLPEVLSELIQRVEFPGAGTSAQAIKAAQKHGRQRKKQGYTAPMLYEEGRVLRRCIYDAVQENLLSANLSHLITDMIEVSDSLDTQLTESVRALLGSSDKPKAA
jgi:YesN/AraC family two-component response regulator